MRIEELKYLAAQSKPVWGGHIARNQPPTLEMQADIDAGWIARSGDGYVIGPEGRKKLAAHAEYHSRECPTCHGAGRV